jgi:NADP-dependent 3-hydroxy acid dehydrogenase YdfG
VLPDQSGRLGRGIALVTGASSGIGLGVARALAARGCRVVLAARRADRLAALAAELGPAALAWPLDLRDPAAVDALPDALPEAFRRIDVLVNNAGHDVGGRRPFLDGPADDWADVIDTNLKGVFRITRAILPGMVARGRGDVVNVGSISGIRTLPNIVAYGTTKAALHMFSDNLRTELAGTGVRLTEVLPGPTRSDFAASRYRGDNTAAQRYYAEASADAPLEAEDVARTIVFALEQPAHMTMTQLVLMPSSRC